MKRQFSIMIPTYGRPTLLRNAIKSALIQCKDVDFEVVVVDNDCENKFNSDVVVSEFNDERLKYVRNNKNLGMCGNWNRCIELATADWLTILHDDDQLHSDYVASVIALVEKAHDISIIGCGVIEVAYSHYANETLPVTPTRGEFLNLNVFDALRGCPYYVAGVAFNKSVAKELGGFDESQYPAMDYDMWFRMIRYHKAALLPDYLAIYRKFENESARKDVLIGFLQQAYRIRQMIISDYSIFVRYFLDIYSRQRILEDGKNLQNVWKVDIGDSLSNEINPDLSTNLYRKISYLIIKVLVVFLSGRKFFKLAISK